MVVGASMLLGRLRKNDSRDRGDEEQEQPPIQDPGPDALQEVDGRTLHVESFASLRAYAAEARDGPFFLHDASRGQAQVLISPPTLLFPGVWRASVDGGVCWRLEAFPGVKLGALIPNGENRPRRPRKPLSDGCKTLRWRGWG